jgi:hypothetical protein
VTVAGVVTADAGRLGTPSLLAIQDGTGAIAVRLPDGFAAPAHGIGLIVTGPLADPYGQLELRPANAGIRTTGSGLLPNPIDIAAANLSEDTESMLVRLVGTASAPAKKATSGDLSIDLTDSWGHAFKVMVDGSSGIVAADLRNRRSAGVTQGRS